MDKITHSSKNITPFGGLNFFFQAMNRMGLDKFLNERIGFRSVFAKYSYSDVVYSLFGNVLTQGSFVADLEVLKEKYSEQFFNKIPSPDTVEYVCQELKTANIIIETDKGIVHQLNYDNKMNETLVALAVKTNQLNALYTDYTVDFDNMITENEKQDALYTYKHCKGYHPGLAFIGRVPVHIENRNGNTPARFQQKETLQRCFVNLKKHNIKIKNFRGDSASYQEHVIEQAEINADYFYIRMLDFASIRQRCAEINNWVKVEINYEVKEVASVLYAPFGGEKQYRIVVTRKKRKDQQLDLLTGCAYTYQGIITNNHEQDDKEVIEFYNLRGDAENSNRYMLGDFNLHHLPFPDMDTNTVYIYLMAMCAILFEWIKTVLVKNKTKGISITMRTKAVCFHYITVATTFINHAHKKILKVFSQNEYVELKI
jgi:hypothetical protein